MIRYLGGPGVGVSKYNMTVPNPDHDTTWIQTSLNVPINSVGLTGNIECEWIIDFAFHTGVNTSKSQTIPETSFR